MLQNGIPTARVPREVKAGRLETCEACPSGKFIEPTRQCGVCGCFMQIKASLEFDPVESAKKAALTRTVCPLSHWPEYVSPN